MEIILYGILYFIIGGLVVAFCMLCFFAVVVPGGKLLDPDEPLTNKDFKYVPLFVGAIIVVMAIGYFVFKAVTLMLN